MAVNDVSLPANKQAAKGERPLYSKVFKDWKGVYTRSARNSCPEDSWYNLENLQPIGPGNVSTIPNISASLHDFAGDTVYGGGYANISNVDYMFFFTTNGKLYAYKISDGTTTLLSSSIAGTNAKMDQWKNQVALFIDSGNLYSWDGATFATIAVAGTPAGGDAIAVYAGRVWIAKGRVLYYSVADGYGSVATDWTAANGAGSVALTDPQIRSTVQQMVAANGYLYLFGRTSINVIADVYVPAGAAPPTPVFTNLNIQAIIGTDQPASVFPMNRNLMLANRFGAFAMSGTTAQKISDDIDGTWRYVDFTQSISGGQVVINNILTAAFLVKRTSDPIFGSLTSLALWWDNKWWFANYGALTFCLSAYANSVPSLFGFIGNKLYQLFSSAASSPNYSWMTPLWGMSDPLSTKAILKAGMELQLTALPGSVSLSVDTSNSTTVMATGSTLAFIVWMNNTPAPVTWLNNLGNVVNWYSSGSVLFAGDAPGGYDRYIGLRGSSTGASGQLSALMFDYQYGKRW